MTWLARRVLPLHPSYDLLPLHQKRLTTLLFYDVGDHAAVNARILSGALSAQDQEFLSIVVSWVADVSSPPPLPPNLRDYFTSEPAEGSNTWLWEHPRRRMLVRMLPFSDDLKAIRAFYYSLLDRRMRDDAVEAVRSALAWAEALQSPDLSQTRGRLDQVVGALTGL